MSSNMRSSKRSQAPIAIIYACTHINCVNLAQFIKRYLFCIVLVDRFVLTLVSLLELKSTKGTTKSKTKGKPESSIWTDDEVELLLTEEYKVKQTAENVDWESYQSKYSDILELFISQSIRRKRSGKKVDRERLSAQE